MWQKQNGRWLVYVMSLFDRAVGLLDLIHQSPSNSNFVITCKLDVCVVSRYVLHILVSKDILLLVFYLNINLKSYLHVTLLDLRLYWGC